MILFHYFCNFPDWHTDMYGFPLDTTTANIEELSEKLRKFYGGAKSKGGDVYHKNTLKNIRGAINRHMQDLGREIDVIRGIEFRSANRVLDGMMKQMAKDELYRPKQHKPMLYTEDIVKISTYFQDAKYSPIKLRQCVWYNLSFHFVSLGAEFHHHLKLDSFIFQKDDNGDEYVTLSDEYKQSFAADKRIYAIGGDVCPVKMLRQFIERTHEYATHLFNNCSQEALASPSTTPKWYGSKPVSKRTFIRFMPDISQSAGCSRKYTTVCLRATAKQASKNADLGCGEMLMSGQRNKGSVDNLIIDQEKLLSNKLSAIACGSATSGSSDTACGSATSGNSDTPEATSSETEAPDLLTDPMLLSQIDLS